MSVNLTFEGGISIESGITAGPIPLPDNYISTEALEPLLTENDVNLITES